ncbi:MAG: helix-turn-helix domain-containing protein [Gemmatimonadaceae bacterium]
MSRHVPVTMGSPRFRVAEAGPFTVTDAWFPPNALLERHTHARAIFAVMLGGSFTNEIAGREYECTPASFWTEPLGEMHANRGGSAGARVFVVQPDPQRASVLEAFAPLLDEVRYRRHSAVALDARRSLLEIGSQDRLAPLAIESSVFSVLIAAARLTIPSRNHAKAPRWIQQAREYVHEHYRRSFRITDLAALLGVEPSRLAHTFRRYHGSTLGEYARAQRLSWALEQLEHSDTPIAKIAVSAGYCDQSHLTREIKRALGVGAAGYRRHCRAKA